MKFTIDTTKQFKNITYIVSIKDIDTVVEYIGKSPDGQKMFSCSDNYEERIANLKIVASEDFMFLYKSTDLAKSIITIPLHQVTFYFSDSSNEDCYI